MSRKPNILVIMSDQLRYDALGCNGNPVIRTPNIDRLAAEGCNFTRAYTPNPLCVPARASFTTGCYSHHAAGSKQNDGVIREGLPLLGAELVQRGYRTYAMGKLHYTPYCPPGQKRVTHGLETVELSESGRYVNRFDKTGELRGLEEYLDYLQDVGWGGYSRSHGLGNNDIFPAPSPLPKEHYVDAWVTDRAIHYMDRHLREQPNSPFFMWVSFPKPHSAYDPPRPFDQMYEPRQMPEPIGTISDIRDRGADLLAKEHLKYGWDTLSPAAHKVIKAYYYGLVSQQDELIGRLTAFLNEKGIRNDTMVLFTSDHGDMLGDFGLYFKKTFYEGSVHIPLMISQPGVLPANRICTQLAGLQDILPTLLQLIGEPLDAKVDGADLSPVLKGNKPVRDYFVSQCNNETHAQRYMVADCKWKYIYHTYGGTEELYDLELDPSEWHNLAGSTEEAALRKKAAMKEYLRSWCVEHQDLGMLDEDRLLQVERVEPKADFSGNTVFKQFGRRFV